MRTIIRFSLNRDNGSALRNPLKAALEKYGLRKTRRTATYEGYLDNNDVRRALRDFWTEVNNHAGPGTVDHFWMYRDNRKPPSPI